MRVRRTRASPWRARSSCGYPAQVDLAMKGMEVSRGRLGRRVGRCAGRRCEVRVSRTVGNSRAARYSCRNRESARALLLISGAPRSDFSYLAEVARHFRTAHGVGGRHVVGGRTDDRTPRRATSEVDRPNRERLIVVLQSPRDPARNRGGVPTDDDARRYTSGGSRRRLLHDAAKHPRVRERRLPQVPRLRHPSLGGPGQGTVRGRRRGRDGVDARIARVEGQDLDGAPRTVRG